MRLLTYQLVEGNRSKWCKVMLLERPCIVRIIKYSWSILHTAYLDTRKSVKLFKVCKLMIQAFVRNCTLTMQKFIDDYINLIND